jgi:histidinol dehydrogenase
MQDACEISNRVAPEHLEISAANPQQWEPLLRHAGAIFMGAFTSESLGDYCAGPNHVLPTAGTSRFSSPLGVYDFCKRSSLIEVSEAGAQVLGPIAAELAYGEGLQAHARAAQMRLRADAPVAAAAPAFSAREINADNVDVLIELQVAPSQRHLVGSVVKSLAQAAYQPSSTPWALYDGDEPVGLLLLLDKSHYKDGPKPQLYIWRLLIDARCQGRGLGKQALQFAIREARRLGLAELGLSHRDAPGHAGPFYEAFGFRYTGEVDDGELEMVLPVTAWQA